MAINVINISIFVAISLTFPLNTCSLVSEHWWGTTTFTVDELKYTWTINNFDSIRLSEKSALLSPEFWAADDVAHKWHLSLEDIDDKNNRSIYLNPSFNDSLRVKYSITINGAESSEIHNFTNGEHAGFKVPASTGFELINMNSITMTIDCTIKKIDTVRNSTRRCRKPEDNTANKELFNDYESLFKNGSYSDVTIYIDNKYTIKAHKAILGARSPVLLEQLIRDSAIYRGRDSTRDIVSRIMDTDHKVFKELLRFIYVGEVEHLDEIAQKLLIEAQKYDVKGLKKLCEDQLCQNLNTHNAFALLTFANEQNLHDLTSVAAKYIATHGSGIVRTDEFKNIESKLNNSLLDVFHAYYDN